MRIKSKEEIKKRFREAVPRVGAAYKDAVSRTSGVIQAAIDAEDVYKAKMEEALANNSRAKGLAKVSDEDWRRGAMEKGAARIGPGMAAAVDKQAANFAPFHDALSSLDLPKKTADPMTNVTNRVGAVVQALVNKKKEIQG